MPVFSSSPPQCCHKGRLLLTPFAINDNDSVDAVELYSFLTYIPPIYAHSSEPKNLTVPTCA